MFVTMLPWGVLGLAVARTPRLRWLLGRRSLELTHHELETVSTRMAAREGDGRRGSSLRVGSMPPMEVQLAGDGEPILDQFSSGGFVDCIFRISGHEVMDPVHRFHLSANHRGTIVGLDVTVRAGIRGGFDGAMDLIQDHVYRHGVQFRRSGPESDRLIQALAALYGQPTPHAMMVAEIDFTAIGLYKDGEADANRDPIRLKLFANDAEGCPEADYFEAFFILDLRAGLAAWNEKDPDYRLPLLRCMTG